MNIMYVSMCVCVCVAFLCVFLFLPRYWRHGKPFVALLPHSGDSDRAPLKEVQVTSQWPRCPFFRTLLLFFGDDSQLPSGIGNITGANVIRIPWPEPIRIQFIECQGRLGLHELHRWIHEIFLKNYESKQHHTSTKGIGSWCWWFTEFTDLGFCEWKRLLRGGWPPTNSKPTNIYHQPTNASNKHAIWKTHVFSQYSMIHDSYLSPPPPKKEQESKSSNHSMKHQIWSKKNLLRCSARPACWRLTSKNGHFPVSATHVFNMSPMALDDFCNTAAVPCALEAPKKR